jgi:hypothetical protein
MFFMCIAAAGGTICASSPLLCGDISPPPAFDATFVTTAGNFTVRCLSSMQLPIPLPPNSAAQVHSERAWAPLASARFYTLCRMGYYSQVE